MDRIIDSFKYVFSQKGWEKKVGILFAVFLAFSLIAGVISFSIQLPIEITNAILEESGRNTSNLKSLSSAASSFSSFLTLPFTLYMLGYLISVTTNIAKGHKELLPEHTEIGNTFVKGAKLYISMFIATLPTTIIGFIIFLTTLIGGILLFSVSKGNPLYLVFGVVLILLTFLIGILITVVNNLVTYASWYIYYKTGSFRESFNFKTIIETIKENEKALLALLLDFIILAFVQMAMGIGALMLICVVFITIPAVAMLGYFAKAYIVGHAFKNMSKLEVK